MAFPLLALGGIVEAVGKVADNLHTSDKERLDADIELRRLALDGAKIEAELVKGQHDINKAEAQHASLFVAGWRPAIGWIGAAALAYQFILYPFLTWGWRLIQAAGWVPADMMPPPVLDADALWVILTGMLGIAGMRSLEKVKGVAAK
jgi:hypothetical protein